MSRRQQLEAIEAAIAAHPKGKPLNDRGELVPDPRPMAPPIGYKKQPSMVDIIREQIRLAGLEAANAGFETFEEADDYDVGDEDPRSPYELEESLEVPASVLRARAAEAVAAEAASASKPPADPAGAEKPPTPPQPHGEPVKTA